MCKRAGIELDDFDALFGGDTSAIEGKLVSVNSNKADYPVLEIDVDLIDGFPEHPFKVIDDEDMQMLAENIAEFGVMHPGIVRKTVNGRYQMISGHRRLFASKKAKKRTMPVRIMDLSDEDATILMADANFLQRVEIKPSEKAKAYKKKYDAIKSQGKQGSGNSLEELGEAAGESGKTVQRFIRLSYLIDELLELLDSKKLGLLQGVDISYLDEDKQRIVLEALLQAGTVMTVEMSAKIKEAAKNGNIIVEMILMILTEKKPKERKITMKYEKIKHYFHENISDAEIEDIIIDLLEKRKAGTGNG